MFGTIIMIYTVTFNPSLDYYVKLNEIKRNEVNRTHNELITVGGKGINVSLALKELGDESVAFGFASGFTGDAIRRILKNENVASDFIEVDGESRINVKIKCDGETDFNGTGAIVTKEHVEELISKLNATLCNGDWLIVSGSVPSSLDEHAYEKMLEKIEKINDIKLVVDACGDLLLNTLRFKPFLIKPNVAELRELFNLKYTPDIEGIASYARKLQDAGARNVIVSLGSTGAIMVTETSQSLFIRATSGKLINSVGAGDSMVAGFLHEYIKTDNYFKALNFATACGSACAFSELLAKKEDIERIESLML